jgi:hypothetical protein
VDGFLLPPATYDFGMDAAFEQAAATYEAGKSNYRLGGEFPLAAISVDPIGRFWYSAWSTCLLGGTYTHAREYTHLLLLVLRNAKSPFVLDTVFRALRSIHRNSESSLGPDLYEELGEALAQHGFQKMDVAK